MFSCSLIKAFSSKSYYEITSVNKPYGNQRVNRKMKKKHQHKDQEEHIDETWLIPYADLLTLLLALFIVLFSMSTVDAAKFKQLVNAINSSLDGGTRILDYPTSIPTNEIKSLNKEKQANKTINDEQKSLKEIQENIENYIKSRNLTGRLKTTLTDEGLLITIVDDMLFDSGVAEVRRVNLPLIKELSGLLVIEEPKNIIISGHTDNVPIRNSQFESNWELSAMRATNLMKVLLENKHLKPALFSVRAYGEYKPIASNTTAEGRKKNRRVEILIVSNKSLQK